MICLSSRLCSVLSSTSYALFLLYASGMVHNAAIYGNRDRLPGEKGKRGVNKGKEGEDADNR